MKQTPQIATKMNNNYSMIKYYIYKELHEYLLSQNKTTIQLCNEFSLSVFSGVLVSIIADEICAINKISYLTIPIIVLVYWIILWVAQHVVRLCIKIEAMYFPKKEKKMSKHVEEELFADIFNYEITYLIHKSYLEVMELSNDSIIRKLQTIDICFNLKTAIIKIKNTLIVFSGGQISEDYIMKEKLKTIIDTMFYTIKKMDTEKEISNELNIISIEYNIIQDALHNIYGLEFNKL